METLDSSRARKYLSSTSILDSDNPEVASFADGVLEKAGGTSREKAVALYYAVRDGIWYDPYLPFYKPEHFRASRIIKTGRGFCVGKASALCAMGRYAGIPSRLGFADVKNHIATPEMIETMGSDLFVYHAFVEFYIEGAWIKATPAFNRELCEKQNVAPLEFDGMSDSIFHEFDCGDRKFMEYISFHGHFEDVPVDRIVSAWIGTYGKERVESWQKWYEQLNR